MNDAWAQVLYFVFGAGGTLCRIALSPTITFGANVRTTVEGIAGGVGGLLLPYFGALFAGLTGLDAAHITAMPALIKAAVVFVLNYTGSFSVGEVLARINTAKSPNP